jgi:hypothetical protein
MVIDAYGKYVEKKLRVVLWWENQQKRTTW